MLYVSAVFLCSGKLLPVVLKAFLSYVDICTNSLNIIITVEAPEIGEATVSHVYDVGFTIDI